MAYCQLQKSAMRTLHRWISSHRSHNPIIYLCFDIGVRLKEHYSWFIVIIAVKYYCLYLIRPSYQ